MNLPVLLPLAWHSLDGHVESCITVLAQCLSCHPACTRTVGRYCEGRFLQAKTFPELVVCCLQCPAFHAPQPSFSRARELAALFPQEIYCYTRQRKAAKPWRERLLRGGGTGKRAYDKAARSLSKQSRAAAAHKCSGAQAQCNLQYNQCMAAKQRKDKEPVATADNPRPTPCYRDT